MFYKDIKDNAVLLDRLSEADRRTLEELLHKKASNIIYGMDTEPREKRLEELSYLLFRLQGHYCEEESEKYHLLTRVLCEQYKIEGEGVELKDVIEVPST